MAEESELTILYGLPETVFEIGDGEHQLGSAGGPSIPLPHPTISPEHCRLQVVHGRCWVEDCGSHSGTYWNGQRLRTRTEIQSGDILQLGDLCLRYDAHRVPSSARRSTMIVASQQSKTIPLSRKTITIGKDPGCDVILPHPEISRLHAKLEPGADRYTLIALSDGGECRVNGQHFDSHDLIFGDKIDLGPYHFHFDGKALHLTLSGGGVALVANHLTITIDGRRILDRASLQIEPCEFVGIIGPTGAGKSSLLTALNGMRPADSGHVFLNGHDLYSHLSQFRKEFGWVPQQDIVHRQLTVVQALTFAARLRLPRHTPEREMGQCIVQTAARLDLERHLGTVVGELSGGEIKKVSVAVELLCRPQIIFLDEPTSGLDPGADLRLMEQLRKLADGGCTVVTTTHTMENIHLLDRLIVMAEGMLIFSGPPADALTFFGVREISGIFRRLDERKAAEWREHFSATYHPESTTSTSPSQELSSQKKRPSFQLPILLSRQWTILCTDWRNFAILLGQPLLIGLLLAWAVRGTLDDSSLKLFFVSVATLWFGCSNGAQEIIGEIAIYRRERMVGLHRSSYLLAKWLFLSSVTLLQSLFLFLITHYVSDGIVGTSLWQIAGLTCMALLATSLGLAISGAARTGMHGVLLVPMVIIPQIILSGYTVPASMMQLWVRRISEFIPSYQLQSIMDLSLLWHQTINSATLQTHLQAFQNLDIHLQIKLGQTLTDPTPGYWAIGIQLTWLIAAYLFTFIMLGIKERENR